MPTLELLESRAIIVRACNDLLRSGADAFSVALLLDSVKADLLIEVPYNALTKYAEEAEAKQETKEEGNANV